MKFNFNNTPKVAVKVAKSRVPRRPKLLDQDVLQALINGARTAQEVATACESSYATSNKVLFRLRKAGRISAMSSGYKQPYVYNLNGESTVKDSKPERYNTSEEIELISDAILDFIARHDGERYTITTIDRDLGLKRNTADRYVRRYIKKGLLDVNFNQGKTPFNPETEDTPIQEEVTPDDNPKTNFDHIEFLVWNYVKETRSTDILAFISWLEAKNK